MNKRLVLASCIALCMAITSGCTGDNNYSAKEEKVLTDYMAKIVLKHSKGYKYRLVNIFNSPFAREEVDLGSSSDDEVVEENINQEDTTTQNNIDSSENNTNSSENSEEQTSVSMSLALGFDENITVKVIKTTVVDDISKGAYYLESKNGEKLVKIDMKITNKSDKKQKVKFKNSSCKLLIDKTEYSPLLTALENDLQFLSTNIDKNKSKTVSLVFSIKEADTKKDKSVKIKTGDIQTTASLN